jgi:hypothetical protein
MARFDKYDPISGGFRAVLAADWTADDGEPVGVGLNTSGKVVPGVGNSGIAGIVILVKENKLAGQVVDVMTDGEIVEMENLTAGTPIFADAVTGALDVTGDTRVGFTVEATRLIVRLGREAVAS